MEMHFESHIFRYSDITHTTTYEIQPRNETIIPFYFTIYKKNYSFVKTIPIQYTGCAWYYGACQLSTRFILQRKPFNNNKICMQYCLRSSCDPIVLVEFKKTIENEMWIMLTQFDSNVPFQLILETNGVYTGDGFYNSRFAVRYMTNCTNVNGRLARYHLGWQWC